MNAPIRRGIAWPAAGIYLYVLAYLGWLLLGGDANRELIGDLAFVPPVFAAALLSWQAGSRAAAVPGMGRAWRLIALALFSWGVGSALQCVYEVSSSTYPTPSPDDLFYLAFYPLFLAGIFYFPWPREAPSVRLHAVLDALTIAIGGSALIWYVVLGPAAYSSEEGLWANMVAISYPMGDLILIVALARLWMARGAVGIRFALRLLAAGVGLFVVGDVIYSYAVLHDFYSGGRWFDSIWMLAIASFALAALRQRPLEGAEQAQPPSPALASERTVLGPLSAALPYLAAAVVFGLLLDAHATDPFFPSFSLALTAALVGALLISREYVARRGLAKANERIAALATTDALTGLANHRALAEAIDRELGRARRYETECSLLFVDIDHFKRLNDSYGHAVGDSVLAEVAAELQGALRDVDTVGRWGGEEFVAILPEVGHERALQAAERLRAGVAARVFDGPEAVRVTVSVGVASFPRDGRSRTELLEAADRAMYAAKHLGRNRVLGAEGSTPVVVEQAQALGGPPGVEPAQDSIVTRVPIGV